MRASISVCMATYNGAGYIREQLSSILMQLESDDEIIVSDDGSTDNTKQIVDSLNDARIKWVVNKGEHGYTPNFENALNHATKDIIILSDQDDVWKENKVATIIEVLSCNDFVVHDAIITDQNLNIKHHSYFENRKIYETLIGNFFKFGFLGCCMAFKRKILDKALPFPKNHKLCTHDNWLFLIGMTFYKLAIIHDPLILYRRHERNTSTGGDKNDIRIGFMIKYRLYLLKNLISRRK